MACNCKESYWRTKPCTASCPGCVKQCPEIAKPIIKEYMSAKMRYAQQIRKYGTTDSGNRHTPNLPGTKRQHIRRKKEYETWRCEGGQIVWGFF